MHFLLLAAEAQVHRFVDARLERYAKSDAHNALPGPIACWHESQACAHRHSDAQLEPFPIQCWLAHVAGLFNKAVPRAHVLPTMVHN